MAYARVYDTSTAENKKWDAYLTYTEIIYIYYILSDVICVWVINKRNLGLNNTNSASTYFTISPRK